MKKVFLGLFISAALLTTGCLGDAPTQILGSWVYLNVYPTTICHTMRWEFQDNGQVIIQDLMTSVQDTGSYEMFMDGTHQIVKIKGFDTVLKTDNKIALNAEWIIVSIDFSNLRIGTRDYGGFQQRDLVHQ